MTTHTRESIDLELGAAIRSFRKRRGMKLGELAETLGLSIDTMSKVEKGTRSIVGWNRDRLETLEATLAFKPGLLIRAAVGARLLGLMKPDEWIIVHDADWPSGHPKGDA